MSLEYFERLQQREATTTIATRRLESTARKGSFFITDGRRHAEFRQTFCHLINDTSCEMAEDRGLRVA